MTADPVAAPTVAQIEQAINDLGYGTPEYHEALAFYLMTLARAQWRVADRIKSRTRGKRALEDFKQRELVRKDRGQ
jgi:hypothetical protein